MDPVSLVHTICKDAKANPDRQRSRYIKRMTPMTLMRKTLGGGLEQVCESVLKPHFHSGGPSKKVSLITPPVKAEVQSPSNYHDPDEDKVGPDLSPKLTHFLSWIVVCTKKWQHQYAIRPTIRNNNTFKRDEVIKLVASAVGDVHTVDLKNYDLLILVDVYRVSQTFARFEVLSKLTA